MRYWLRDVIDFSDEPHGALPVEHADECDMCDPLCQEIANSLALDGAFIESAERDRMRDLERHARISANAFDQ